MPQTDNSGSVPSRRVDTSASQRHHNRHPDWAVLVVLLALGCTLGWISLLLWGAMRAFQIALL